MAEEKRREPCCEELRTAGVLNRERLGGDATGDLQDGNTDPATGVQMLDTLHQSVEYTQCLLSVLLCVILVKMFMDFF